MQRGREARAWPEGENDAGTGGTGSIIAAGKIRGQGRWTVLRGGDGSGDKMILLRGDDLLFDGRGAGGGDRSVRHDGWAAECVATLGDWGRWLVWGWRTARERTWGVQ